MARISRVVRGKSWSSSAARAEIRHIAPAFNDSSDFVSPGANEETFANAAALPRSRDHQSLVQQELERSRGISFETRSLLPSGRLDWNLPAPRSTRLYRSPPSRRPGGRTQLRRPPPASALFVSSPRRVSFCIRRKARREVLFALRIGGLRGIGRNGVRRSLTSHWRC